MPYTLMGLYDRILVPTDGSEGVERAVDHAIELALEHGAEIHAIYVVNPAHFSGIPMEGTVEGVSELYREDAEAAVEAVAERCRDRGVEVEPVVAEGTPSAEIVRYAERNDCDVVVMGTHGRGGIDRLLLGSVAEKVVRASEVPVLTIQVNGKR
ncbi:MAG: universal stress protein [Haloferacaceae archaeon]